MKSSTCGLWLASFVIAEAANHGSRNIHRRQDIVYSSIEPETKPSVVAQASQGALADKFEGLRLSYVTDTVTEKVTETVEVPATLAADAATATVTVTVTQSAAVDEAVGDKPAVTVTVTEPAVNEGVEAPPALTVTVTAPAVNEAVEAPPAVTVTEVKEIPQEPVTVVSLITESFPLPITVVDVITESINLPVTVIEVVTESIAQPPITVTEQVTVAGEVLPAVTVTEQITITAEALPALTLTKAADKDTAAPATVTQTKTVTESCDTPANGVFTIPIADSAKPTTTFGSDPFAQSLILDLDPSPSVATLEPEAQETQAASQPTDYVNSVDLGGIEPDATADAGSAGETDKAEQGGIKYGLPVDIESLTLSSVLDLGNLGGGLKARATDAP